MFHISKIISIIGLSLALTFIYSCIPNDANEYEHNSSSVGEVSSSSMERNSSAEENSSSSISEVSSSSTERSSSDKANNCYWYGNGNGMYYYKCGFEPPCYTDPSCPACDVCYPYPTECNWVNVSCLDLPDLNDDPQITPDCQQAYECHEVTDPGRFKLVEQGECCAPPTCYKEEDEEELVCPTVCSAPTTVNLKGIESLTPMYACYWEKYGE